jgi:ubiquinone/menaquinone biosynthesis C-methylase UbiE
VQSIGAVAPAKNSRIVDIGGGASLLVDRLVDAGYTDVTVVDVSAAALDLAKARLADRAKDVKWLVADARHVRLPEEVDVWHDRAVFHFLITEADRAGYLDSVRRALCVGGHVVIATFALGGPERCSGLPVERYDAEKLSRVFGPDFSLVLELTKQHVTPAGTTQEFTYAILRRAR